MSFISKDVKQQMEFHFQGLIRDVIREGIKEELEHVVEFPEDEPGNSELLWIDAQYGGYGYIDVGKIARKVAALWEWNE